MNLKIETEDPLKILSTTKRVVEKARSVNIDESNINNLIKPIKERVEKGLELASSSAGSLNDFKKDSQLILVEDCVNFCFWAEKDKEKWQVEYPKGNIVTGGWYGLEACFKRSLEKDQSILSAEYLANIKLKDTKEFFKSANNVEIPLLKERLKNLKEAGRVLLSDYDGQFFNLLEKSNYDAINIVKNIAKSFTSFKDLTFYEGENVYFYKRAQIVANDLSLIFKNGRKTEIKNIRELTAFADYKLPQMLRMFGVMVYSKELAEKVDKYVLVLKDSKEEVEIRSATVWAVEMIRQYLPQFNTSQIDNAIWLISQDTHKEAKPYHRTYTIYY
jgi:hypothetical protein